MKLKQRPKTSYRRYRRVRVAPGQLSLFVQKDFDSRAILNNVFDFVTCLRPDGTFYGNGGAQCKKGVEASPITMLEAQQKGYVSKNAAAMAEKHASFITDSLEQDVVAVAAIKTKYDEVFEEIKGRAESGDLKKGEVEDFILNGADFDIMQAEFVMIGMEPGGPGPGTNTHDQIADGLAVGAMQKQGFELNDVMAAVRTYNDAEIAEQGKIIGGGQGYINKAVQTSDVIVRPNEAPLPYEQRQAAFSAGKKIGSIEMSNLGAISTTDGIRGSARGEDPKRSTYGVLMQQKDPAVSRLDRNTVKDEYSDKRAEAVYQSLKTAAKDGKLQAAMAVTGGGQKFDSFRDEVIGKFHNGSLDRDKTNVVTVPVELNIAGKTQKHEAIVVDLGSGKSLVAVDYSQNAMGYGHKTNRDVYNQAVTAAKTGNGKAYDPSIPSRNSIEGKSSGTTSQALKALNDPQKLYKLNETAKKQDTLLGQYGYTNGGIEGRLRAKSQANREQAAKWEAELKKWNGGDKASVQQRISQLESKEKLTVREKENLRRLSKRAESMEQRPSKIKSLNAESSKIDSALSNGLKMTPPSRRSSSAPSPSARRVAPKVEAPKEKKNTMGTWSKGKLERALQRAYDQGDDAKVDQIRAILGGMS